MCNSYYIIIITQKGFYQCPHMYVNTDVCVCVFAVGALTAVSEVSQHILNNTQRHENHLQLCRVQKLLKGRKTKVLAAG